MLNIFGCKHSNYTFPQTPKADDQNTPKAAQVTGTYVACLECGKEFPYDWKNMCIVSPKRAKELQQNATMIPASI